MSLPDPHASPGSRDSPRSHSPPRTDSREEPPLVETPGSSAHSDPSRSLGRRGKPPFPKRLLLAAAILGLLLAGHRPVMHALIRGYLVRTALRSGLNLDLEVSGNVWTQIRFSKIRLAPDSAPHPMLESLQCGHVALKYSPTRALWSGPAESVQSYRITSVDLRLHSLRTAPKAASPAEKNWIQTLETVLALPALYADTVQIEDVSVRIADGDPLRAIRGFELSAFPDRGGRIGFETIEFNAPASEAPAFQGRLSGSTNYEKRRLVLHGLQMSESLHLARFAFDASERVHGRSRVEAEFTSGAGRLRASLFAQKPGHALSGSTKTRALWRVELDGQDFPLRRILEQSGLYLPGAPDIHWLESHLEGAPAEPLSWTGQADLRSSHTLASGTKLEAEVHAALEKGAVHLRTARVSTRHSQSDLSGHMRLPSTWTGWREAQASLDWDAHSSNLREWTGAGSPGTAGGASSARGKLQLKSGTLEIGAHAGVASLALPAGSLGAASIALEAAAPLESLGSGSALARGLSARATARIETARVYAGSLAVALEAGSLDCAWEKGDFLLNRADFHAGPNRVCVRGVWSPPLEGSHRHGIRDAFWEVACPSLERAGLKLAGHALGGALESRGNGEWKGETIRGDFTLAARALRWGEFELPAVRAEASAEGARAHLRTLEVTVKPEGHLTLSAAVDLKRDRAFEGEFHARLPRLGTLKTALRQLGFREELSGSVDVAWKGSGRDSLWGASGEWEINASNIEYKSFKINSLGISGRQAPDHLEASGLRFAAGETTVQGRVIWNADALQMPQILVEQGGKEVLGGELYIPLGLRGGKVAWNTSSALKGELSARRFNLGTLWKTPGERPAVSGTVDLRLELGGSPQSPWISLLAGGTGLQSQRYAGLPACNLKVSARHESGHLQGEAVLESALGGPARLRASCAIPLARWLEKESWAEAEVDGHLDWPRMRLEPLPTLWPALRKISGEASVQGRLGGRWNAPEWSGNVKLECSTLHFANDRLPAVTDLRLALHGKEGRVRIQNLRADLGGGTLEIRGEARGKNLANPTLDLTVLAQQVLVQRSQQLSLRLDGNLHIAGLLDAAKVTGSVVPVKSVLRRDIEVLPLAAFSQASSGYKRSPGKPWFTFSRGPLANWAFDVHIRSRPEDPILIRGNRLRGSALSDLRFQGTGRTPTISGSYQTDDLLALLPFARLEVSRGRVWFDAADPFAAQVDISAETEVRSHRIRLYLHGTPESPAVSVSSDPPLPERDALTLLTTGSLPGVFGAESNQSVAARAAGLLLQEFSDKFLENSTGSRERFSALRRFNLEMGAINNRTGTQETRLTYRIQDNLFLIGEVGANGDFASRLRYILRFR